MFDLSRRHILGGLTAAALANLASLRYAKAQVTDAETEAYRSFEDLARQKWTWDNVVRGTHGTNCAGQCAFNVYVKNGIAWREEQLAAYESSGDAPDYNPRGCQKGLRHAKYMYGPQRVLYPMKRVGDRGAGQWQRISWEQACEEVADRFLDHATESGPESISMGSGTMMTMKLATMAAFNRFATLTGVSVPEFFSGVGDLPTGVYLTCGSALIGDTIASVFDSKYLLVWMANPAVTRIPDAHFFWEARYNGTTVVAISPEFTPTAMHCNRWINPKPGTDIALALAMVHTIIEDQSYDRNYIVEQTDLPLLVRTDNNKFLRIADLADQDLIAAGDGFCFWDADQERLVRAPGTGGAGSNESTDDKEPTSLALGDFEPALEGSWTVETNEGPIEIATVFELLKLRAAQHTPEWAAEITGVNAQAIRETARSFAAASPAMIYCGMAACKWMHGDMLQRAMLLLLSLTGNIGRQGGGLQITNFVDSTGHRQFSSTGLEAPPRIISAAAWDYEHAGMRELNEEIYGSDLADEFDAHYQESTQQNWFPSYGKNGWKMGIFAGNNAANWRAAGNRWREEGFLKLETIVAIVPDMGMTAMHADYVLPIAHHYERADMMVPPLMPYVHVLDAAVPPLGEAVDDWTAMYRLAEAISGRAEERGIQPITDSLYGRTITRDFSKFLDLYTMNGQIKGITDVVEFVCNQTPGLPNVTFSELAERGIVRVDGSESTAWDDPAAPFATHIAESVKRKRPYHTETGRQQYYIDNDWFLKFDEQLPTHKDPIRLKDYPLQMMMGHARHGVHSMWRDDPLMLQLQRGEPDIYVNPDDAQTRNVKDGDHIRIFNSSGAFTAMAHPSSGIQPGMVFMYHGWDPMMFPDRQNFSAVICTGGLIKPTAMAGGSGHLGYHVFDFAPNQTYKDFTVDFELAA